MGVDAAGKAYVAGTTNSATGIATTGAQDTTLSGTDGFVVKIDPTLSGASSRLFGSYVGGSGTDEVYGVAVDAAGQAYVTGYAQTGFVTTAGAYDATFNGSNDAFLRVYSATGTALVYSTYLGGAGDDGAEAITLDASGKVYLTGWASTGFATTGTAYQTAFGGGTFDAFVAKFDIAGSGAASLVYSTLLGGAGTDVSNGVAVDSLGQAHITGYTSGSLPTTAGAFQTTYGGGANDAFYSTISAAGASLVYSTYLGGIGDDQGAGITVGSSDSLYIAGYTASGNFSATTAGAFDISQNGSYDAFVLREVNGNNSPVLDASAAVVLAAESGAAASPVGAVGTLVFSIVDLPGGGGLDNASDADSGAVTGIAITAADTANGAWWYSTNNGASWNALGAVSSVSSRLLAADASARIYFQSNASYSGTLATGLTFRAWDQTSGTNGGLADTSANGGGTAFSTATDTASITVVGGSTVTVTTTADVADGNTSSIAALLGSKGADGKISLREAIIATNNSAGADQIILSAGTYQLTISGLAEDLAVNGDLDIRDALTITGAGSAGTIIDGNAIGRVFQVLNNSTASMSNLTISNGADSTGGGILVVAGSTLDLSGVVLSANRGNAQGGAILNAGTLTLTDVQMTGNSVFANKGGGLVNTGTVTATRVTFDGNSAKNGGAIYNDTGGTMTLTNVTVSGNTATQYGGGIYNVAALTVTNTTITANNAGIDGGGMYALLGVTTLKNTIVAGNTVDTPAAAIDYSGVVISAGNNLVGSTAGGVGWSSSDLQNVSAGLDPVLKINSGMTPTHALLAGSAAINAGTGTGAPATDERGLTRTVTDIGAYEYGASSLVVDVASDVVDGNTSSIAALLASKGADGMISLREAITAANNTAGLDIIGFNISGSGVRTIQLNSALPTITDAVIIDATSQSGYAGSPLIQLDGNNAGFGANGFTITGGGSTVRGFIINRFDADGIAISGGGGNVIAGNYIGTDAAGSSDRGNGLEGINITNSANNRIGGTAAADRNVIAGNDEDGIDIIGAAATGNVVLGNYIGLNAAGTAGLGNAMNGIWMGGGASNNTIGGTAAGSGNVVSASGDDGIEMQDATTTGNVVQGNFVGTNAAGTAAIANLSTGVLIENSANNVIGGAAAGARNVIAASVDDGVRIGGTAATGNIVKGNYIGTDVTGTVSLGNTGAGVKLASTVDGGFVGAPTNNTIGGINAGEGNLISFNTGAGVNAVSGTGNSVRGNSIYANGGIGIDLNNDGVTLNDAGDGDGGANLLKNFPVLTSALIGSAQIAITGTFNSAVGTVNIDFYSSPSKDASGYGEGRVYLGSASVTTNGAGNATFNAILSASVSAGDWISATATDAAGNTSEFSASIAAAMNARPVLTGANNPAAINEDAAANAGTLVSALIAGRFSDANAGSLTGIAVTAVDNSNGTWQYSTNGGGAWSAFGAPTTSAARLLAADANTYVRFVPNANWNGTVINGISFRAWDQTSGVAGGTADTNTDPTVRDNFGSRTYTNNDGTQNWATGWVETEPFGASNNPAGGRVLITDAAALQYPEELQISLNATLNSIVRGANLAGATSAILSFDFVNLLTGTQTFEVQISSNGGAFTRPAGGSFSTTLNTGSGTLSFDISAWISANTQICFQQIETDSTGYMIFDNVQIAYGNASGNSSAFSTATASASITVNAVNDAPAGASNSVTTLEDTAYTFTAADFGFSDASDAPSNALLAVKMTTLPGVGTLKDNGVNVTAGQVVSVADISSGKLKFTAAANGAGATYASFTFQVEDDGGTANGGADLDATPRTMTVNVTAVNDAPVGTNKTVTVIEGAVYTFGTADFGFTDPADSVANALLNVKITTLPAAGTFKLSGVAVTAGQIVSAASIAAGNLKFTPAADASGNNYASFTFQVQDDGGTANGGVDLDTTPRTLTVNVMGVNDAPAGTNTTVTAVEDTAYTFAAADFGFTDPTDSPANALLAVKVTTLPGAGSLKLSGVAVTAGQFVSAANIAAGNLKFTPAANANGTNYASFTFQVQDDGGTANGGVDLDASANTLTVNVAAVNDAPIRSAGTVNNLTVLEDSALTSLGLGSVSYTEGPADESAQNVSYRVTAVPGAALGTVFLADGTTAVTANTTYTLAQLRGMQFKPLANANGGPATLSWTVQDNGGTANGGIDTLTESLTITVTSVNDAPAGVNTTVTTLEDGTYTFVAADFGFTDAADSPANTLLNVKITTVPAVGSLKLSGTAVTAGQFVSAANINAGNLKFTPAANASGAGYASFTFQVQDSGGTVSGGIDLDATPNTLTINVTPVNDAPVGTNKTVTTLEDTAYTFTVADFGFTDAGDTPANALLNVKIVALPGAGSLKLAGVAVTAGQFVSATNIAAGNLKFTPAANADGNNYASFTFRVQDDGGTANGGVDLDTSNRTLTVSVTTVNDAPAGANKTVTVLEDATYTFAAADFGFSDAADSPANALLNVKMTTLAAAGSLTLSGVAVTAGQLVSAANITAGNLKFTPAANGNGTGYAAFTFQVQDDGGTASGGVDLDATPRTLTVNVTAVNDAPVGTNTTVTTPEDTAYVFAAADFGYTDPLDAAGAAGANALSAVKITTLPAAGALKNNGVAVTAGQVVTVADINAGKLVFTPAANVSGAAYASFTFQVQDNGGTLNGGVNLDAVARTLTIGVTAVNDAPVISGLTGAVAEAAGNATTAGNQTEPVVAIGASGSYVVVWTSDGGQDGSSKGVFGRRFDTSGNARGAEFQVNTYTSNDQKQPAVGMAANGSFVVVWTSNGQDGNNNGVYGQRFDAAGNKTGAEFHVSVATAGRQESASVAVAADGSFVVAWRGENGASKGDIYIRRYDAAGNPLSGEVRVNTSVVDNQDQPVIGIDAAGNFVVAWKTLDAVSGNGKGVSVQRFDSAGNALGTEFQANTCTSGDQDKPTIAVAPDGRFVIAWSSNGQDGSGRGVYAQRFTPAGARTGGEFRVSTTTANDQDVPSAAMDGAGNFVIAWASDLQDGSGEGIYAQRYNAAGVAVGGEYRVSTTTANDQNLPALAMSAGGDLVAVWQGNSAGDSSGVAMQYARGSVAVVEDGAFFFSTANGNAVTVTDIDAGAGNVQATLTVTNGTITLSGIAGLAFSVGDGTADATMTFTGTLAAVNAALDGMSFVPAPNFNGSATLGLQANDLGNTGSGGALTDSKSIGISVLAVNDAPTGTNRTVTALEDTAYVFAAADFGFTDAVDAAQSGGANALANVKLTTLPGAGTLALSGVAVSAGQLVSAASIAAGNLKFTPAANASGAGYASFTFQVQDDGGTLYGGSDIDATPRTLTVNATAVNDAPSTTVPAAQSATTNTPLVFSTAGGNRIAVADVDAGANPVQVTLAIANGTLTLSSTAGLVFSAGSGTGDAGMTFTGTIADINAALDGMRFDPAFNYAGSTTLSVTTNDQGNTGIGGAKSDAHAIVINVSYSNTAPVLAGANNLLLTLEDAAVNPGTPVTGLIALMVTDANPSALTGIAVTAVDNTNGSWQYTVDGGASWTAFGNPTASNARLLEADANAFVRFQPNANWNGTVNNGITFRAWDQTSGTQGGVADTTVNGGATAFSVATASAGIAVASVNDAPRGTSGTVTALEDTAYTFTAADFGYSDALDSPANALMAVQITTLPVAGTLQNGGVAVTAGQRVSAADISAGKLVFTPAANANGAAYASFTFQVQDDGGTANGGVDLDAVPRTLTVDVTAVNDAPVAAGSATLAATLEDALAPAGASVAALFGGNFTDVTDAANAAHNQLAGVAVRGQSVSAAQGRWQYSTDGGGTWSNFGAISDTNALSLGVNDRVRFMPAANFNGTPGNLSVRLIDNSVSVSGGMTVDASANGGTSAFSAAIVTAATSITPVNDAPAGTDKTVSTVQDVAYTFNAADFGFTDPGDVPSNVMTAVAISTLPGVGTLRNNGVTVTAGQLVSVADIGAGLLVFTPDTGGTGGPYATFTFQVQDDGGTANGGSDIDATPRTLTVNVTTVNDAPVGTDNTVTTREDTGYAFTAADFGFTDPADTPANALTAVRLATLPLAGALQNNGVNVTAGQFVSLADINAGKLVFTPAADISGAGSASFTFQVQDDGGTASGGVDLDATPRTMTVNVTAVNDAPAGANQTVTTIEDIAYSFTVADFGFTDTLDSPANLFSAVRITTLPAAGTLTNNGLAVSAGQFIGIADIDAGNFVFTPAANASGAGYASFTFQVQDDGGTADGGADLDATPRTLTVNVVSVNDEPEGADRTIAALEDTAYTLTVADFGLTDASDSPANALLNVMIATLPGAGSLTLGGVAVTGGQWITAADIGAGNLVFTAAANVNGAAYAAFSFRVQDNGGTANGGVDTDISLETITFDVMAVNDAPAGSSNTVTTLEDAAYTFTAADFGFADTLDSPGHLFSAVMVTTLPGAGTLINNGVNVTAGQFVSIADINAGNFVFTPAADANGTALAQFAFQVQDDGGTAGGGVDLDPTPRVMTINVTAVNDAPVLTGAHDLAPLAEDTTVNGGTRVSTLIAGMITDVDSAAASGMAVTAVDNTHGAWQYSLDGGNVWTAFGTPSAASARLLAADTDTYVRFVPNAGWNGSVVSGLTFQAWDQTTGTAGATADTSANGGSTAFSVLAASSGVTVGSVNDAPAGASNTVTTLEDTAYVFSAADFGFTDGDDSPANALIAVKITALPASGTLTNDGVAVTAGQFIAVADINAGKLVFTPVADANGAGYASFAFCVQDDGGVANGGVDLDATARTMTVNVIAVNDAPSGTDHTLSMLEGSTYVFSVADFGFTDTRDALADPFAAVIVTTLPGAGTLFLNGVPATAGQLVSVAEIVAGRLAFSPAAGTSGAAYTDFTFQVQDGGGTANSGSDLDPTARTITVNVTAVPVLPPPVLVVLPPPAPAVTPPASTPPAPAATTPTSTPSTPATPAAPAPAPAPQTTAAAVVPPPPAPVVEATAPSRASGDTAAPGSQGSAGAAPAAIAALKGAGLLALQWISEAAGNVAGFLSAPAANTPADFKLAQVVASAVQQPAFERALDKAREEAQEQVQQEERVVSSAIMGSTGLSVGYLVWLLRSGTLITSLLSSMPAWRTLDPFPVLSQLGEEEEEDDDDSLEALVKRDDGAPPTPNNPDSPKSAEVA